MEISITTQQGTQYRIDEDDCFLRYNQHHWQHPHKSWKCCGVAERLAFNNFHYFGLPAFIRMVRAKQITTFKNGSARFYLRDNDHGTERLQMDGIASAFIN